MKMPISILKFSIKMQAIEVVPPQHFTKYELEGNNSYLNIAF